ncbi:MAG: hypothetical protein GQ574_02735 [Crocinitomix sp.]|nr:hypothetical protein [Crocinitomix sp.]
MKYLILFSLFFIANLSNAQSQSKSWTIAPSTNLGFTENLERYNSVMDEEIQFFAEYGTHRIFFSNDAFVIGQAEELSKEEAYERHEKEEHGEEVEPISWDYFKIEFQNVNPAAEIQFLNQKQHTRNFRNPANLTETILAHSFDRVLYKNIYPNIDLELQLPAEGGLKYNFLVHPGGSHQDILMSYVGAEVQLDAQGGLLINSELAPFTDQAPVSTVLGLAVETKFQVNNNQVSFNLAEYDHAQELIIDPWIVTPIPGATTGMEVTGDDSGNATVLTLVGAGQEMSYYDNTGALQWTFGPVMIGDITMNPATGETYLTNYTLGDISQFDLFGVITATNVMSEVGLPEVWRVKYSDFHDKITVGEGGLSGADMHVSIMPNDLSTYTPYICLPDPGSIMEDCALFEVDKYDGSFYYCPSGFIGGSPSIYGNRLHKLDPVDPTIMLWDTYTAHDFQEISNATYAANVNGVNGITAGLDFVYSYDGNKVMQYDKMTGELLDSLLLLTPVNSQFGIDMDDCGNLYVGSETEVLILTAEMEEIGTIATPGAVRDLLVVDNHLYVTGASFLTEIELEGEGGDAIMSITGTPSFCASCSGTATISFVGCGVVDIVPESILWEPSGSTDITATDLCEGWHVATVTWINDEGETVTQVDSVEVTTEELDITVDITVTDEACPGSCNGEVTITPTSGEAPYTYDVDGTTNGTGIFTGLCAGTFDVTVTDDNGCEFTGTVTIGSGDGLRLNLVTSNNPTCYGFTDGSITVEVAGGLGDVTYIWIPENPIEGATFNTIGAGTYIVHASDDGDCSDSLVIVLTDPDSLWADLSVNNPLCYGDSTGFAVITDVHNAQGDLDNISYFWAPNYFGGGGVGVDSAYNMPAGGYTVTINDDNGCSNVMDFTIIEPDQLVFSEFGYDPAFCRLYGYQSGNGVIYVAATGGTPDYDYYWLNLETLDDEITSTWGGLNPGTYQVTVTDENGCTLIETIELDSVSPIAAFTVDSDQLNEDCEGTELVIANFINQSEYFANPNNPSADTTFLWNLNHPIDPWIISHDFFQIMDTSYVGEAVYEVCLIAQNKNGCADTTCKDIIVHVQPELIAPNIFTPGSNGLNDLFTFEFLTFGIESFHCTIVNRWGITVAELNDINQGWDGTDRNGDDCVAGVYFYVYEAVSTNATAFDGQGNVQLIRE